MMDINNTDIKVEVSEFKGKMRVDLRRWYQDKNTGEWNRTAKGLNVSIDEWEIIEKEFENIKKYIGENK